MKNKTLFFIRLRVILAIIGILVLYSLIHEHAYKPLREQNTTIPSR